MVGTRLAQPDVVFFHQCLETGALHLALGVCYTARVSSLRQQPTDAEVAK